MKLITFKDKVKLYAIAGNGGDGICSFRREKYVPRGGPDGGDGGRGGHVTLKADPNANSLLDLYYNPHQKAEHGGRGGSARKHGKNGEDRTVLVPPGTVVTDLETEEILGELVEEGEELLVARGGKGGMGNIHFVTSSYQAPREFTLGEPGEEKTLQLELKLVADVGLVGYPNAGKSTLIRSLTEAKPKTAPYPFTTLNPTIGVITYDDFNTLKVADIPGLIDGAHEGVGLGHEFLRHIERTTFLVFVIDMGGVDGRHPWDDYKNLREELRLYREELDSRPFYIAANKMDWPGADENLARFIEKTGETPLEMIAELGEGVSALREDLYNRFFRNPEL